MAQGLSYRRLSSFEQGSPVQQYIERMSHDHLKTIQWSEESLSLSNFVQKYPLPQLVLVEEGFDSGQDENSLSSGQVLKIHTLATERKARCLDRHNKEVHIPLHTIEKINLRPENFDIVYQKVSDLAKAKPAPSFVEVTRGYYDVDSNVNYELSVEPGEILEIVKEQNLSNLMKSKKNKYMTFRNKEGVELKLPFDCVVGFKPLVDNKEHSLAEIIASDDVFYPFYFEFTNNAGSHGKLGILKCLSVSDDKLIIASCGHDTAQVVFMIPQDLEITVKVALGTINQDPSYENIKSSFHNFQILEQDIQKERNKHIFRTSSQISGFSFTKNRSPNWEVFDEDNQEGHKKVNENGDLILIENTEALNVANGSEKEADLNKRLSLGNTEQHNMFYLGETSHDASSSSEAHSSVENRTETSLDVSTKNEVVDMSVDELAENLKSIKMRDELITEFIENNIDGALFASLEDDELKDLGANKFEIKKLHMFKKGWRPKI